MKGGRERVLEVGLYMGYYTGYSIGAFTIRKPKSRRKGTHTYTLSRPKHEHYFQSQRTAASVCSLAV